MRDRARAAASWLPVIALAIGLQLLLSCGSDPSTRDATGPEPNPTAVSTGEAEPGAVASAALPPEGAPELLGDWAQLEASGGLLVLADGVVPYTLNSPLFSDYAHKLRTVWLPDGSQPAAYDPVGVFDFPVGTVITKTFYYPRAEVAAPDDARVRRVDVDDAALAAPLDLEAVRLVETRVLVHRADGWHALPYVWNVDQTEATLARAGDLVDLTLVDDRTETPFSYVVPDVNQCASCHATNHTSGAIVPIGPKARHLNVDVDLGDGVVAQLAHWQDVGLVAGLPALEQVAKAAVWDDDTVPLDDRARAYLDINCAHCHNEAGSADTSGLFLEASTELGPSLGVCKAPIAAGAGTGGRLVGIHPGAPDESIFVYRMNSTDPAAMMPELGRSLTHTEGVDLISTWIESLTGTC